MNIGVPEMDGRSVQARWGGPLDVIDTDADIIVGLVRYSDGLRIISLFDGKYEGRFHDDRECQAFARGVEAVLDHGTHQSNVRSAKSTIKRRA